MTPTRKTLIDAEATPFYHIINRGVSRAFLCGEDELTGKSVEHRRGWIVDKVKTLSAIFSIACLLSGTNAYPASPDYAVSQ